MKYLQLIATVVLLSSCQEVPKSNPKKPTSKQQTVSSPKSPNVDMQRVECLERDSMVKDVEDPIIIKECLLGTYRTVTVGEADYKGRYSYEYELQLRTSNGFKKIENRSMFIKQAELLEMINDKLKEDYASIKSDPKTADCLDGQEQFVGVKSLNDLQIEFSEKTMDFNYSFGLSDACSNVDGAIVSIKLNDIEKFVRK